MHIDNFPAKFWVRHTSALTWFVLPLKLTSPFLFLSNARTDSGFDILSFELNEAVGRMNTIKTKQGLNSRKRKEVHRVLCTLSLSLNVESTQLRTEHNQSLIRGTSLQHPSVCSQA